MDSIHVLFALGLCRVVCPHVCSYGFLEFEKKRSSEVAVHVPRHVKCFIHRSPMPAKESSLCFWALGDLSGCEKNTSSFVDSYRVILMFPIGGCSRKGHPEPFELCWVVISGILAARRIRVHRSWKKTSQQTVARCRNMFNESLVTTIANSYRETVYHRLI